VVPAVVQSFDNILTSFVSLVQSAETLNCLVSSGVDSDVIWDVKTHLVTQLTEVMQPLDFLSSRYKQDRFFHTHQLAVKRESVAFGTNFSSHGGTSRLVYESLCNSYTSVRPICLLYLMYYLDNINTIGTVARSML